MITALFFLLSLGAFVVGALVWMGAQSAIHEILAGVSFIVGAIFAAAAAAVDAINRLRDSVERADRNAWSMGRHVSKVLQHPETDHGEPGELPKN